jgi:hypothetical protein
MAKKKEKLSKLSSEHKEGLMNLSGRPEFKALESLFKIEENNIIIQAFKIPSSDPELARRKAHLEGRIYQIRKIIRTFEIIRKVKK